MASKSLVPRSIGTLLSADRPTTSRGMVARASYAAAAAALAGSGYIHAQLYLDDYKYIHIVGVLFLLQAAASFALAPLLLAAAFVRPSILIPLAAAGAALGALAGFAASRTVGVFGFTEHGLQPSPQALLSVLTEIAVLLLLAATAVARGRSSEFAFGRIHRRPAES